MLKALMSERAHRQWTWFQAELDFPFWSPGSLSILVQSSSFTVFCLSRSLQQLICTLGIAKRRCILQAMLQQRQCTKPCTTTGHRMKGSLQLEPSNSSNNKSRVIYLYVWLVALCKTTMCVIMWSAVTVSKMHSRPIACYQSMHCISVCLLYHLSPWLQ